MAPRRWRLILLAMAAFVGPPGLAMAAVNSQAQECLTCHGSPDGGPPFVDAGAFAASPHGAKSCGACHADVKEYPHPSPVKKVDCGFCHAGARDKLKTGVHGKSACVSCHGNHAMKSPRKLGAALCARCHAGAAAQYAGSVHGRARAGGDTDAAICLSCHGGGHAVTKVSGMKIPETCARCHSDPVLAKRHGLSSVDMYKAYMNSTHAKAAQAGEDSANCASCHGHHDIQPAGDPTSRVAAGNIVKTCGRCHAVEAKKFAASVHGLASKRGARGAPTCVDCHGEHDIRSPSEAGSSVARANRAKACADCHQSARLSSRFGDRVQSFQASFHAMAGQGGDIAVADCASCHGWHDVQPSSDARSRTHPANLARTCGQCHEGAGKRWGEGRLRVHEALAQRCGGSRLAALVAAFYGVAIPMTVLGMLLHNALDLRRKIYAPRARRHRLAEVPLSVSERWQHAALGLCFLLLAYSGFALHDPSAWWARPFHLLGGEAARRNAHRAAAALFLLTAAAHMNYLRSAKGRARLRAMLPTWRDLSDPLKVLAYNCGASHEKPAIPQFSYVEKFEYWALVWGSVIMTLTGALLLFHNLALAWLPLWMTETARVIHYLEAVLACLAILIWHGYWVVFDPEIYPMNSSWLTGETYRKEP